MRELPGCHVVVRFGDDIGVEARGKALLALERDLRRLAPDQRIEVFQEARGDDSKLRAAMTPEQRARL